jgi:NAD(P)-dependent dehydrogenase (short-subunit alcohol dehydrogenase family)
MGRLADRVAFITGAGQGVGEGVALAFASEGAAIGVVDLVLDCARWPQSNRPP